MGYEAGRTARFTSELRALLLLGDTGATALKLSSPKSATTFKLESAEISENTACIHLLSVKGKGSFHHIISQVQTQILSF